MISDTRRAEPPRTDQAGPQALIRWVLAVAIVGGPLGYALGSRLIPSVHEPGTTTLAAVQANPVTNAVHMVAYVLASFLLPIGALGLAYLAYRRTPWLATVGGLLAVLGWLPMPALVALDDLATVAAGLPARGLYAELYDRFSTDPVMTIYLLVYVVGHLLAYVLLGVALHRGRVIPAWAAWALVASSPLTVVLFALPGAKILVVGWVALGLLVIGSIPAAHAMVRMRSAATG